MSPELLIATWNRWIQPCFEAVELVPFIFATASLYIWRITESKKNCKKLESFINRNSASLVSTGTATAIGTSREFLNRLVKQIQRKFVDFYIEESGIDIPATKYLTTNRSDYKSYLILAGSGFGKTSLMIKLHQKMKNAQLFGLAKYSSFEELNEEISNHLKKNNQNAFETVILLDGFDEYPVAWKDRKKAFNDLFTLQKKYSKVVITCRNTFYEIGNGNLTPEQDGFICIKQLKPYNEDQIRKFIKLKFGGHLFYVFHPGYYSAQNVVFPKQANGTRTLLKIFQRPLMLSMIDDLRNSDIKKFRYEYTVYKKCVDSWCARESSEKEILFTRAEDIPTNIKAKKIKESLPSSLQAFMLEISELMYKNRRDTLQCTEIPSSLNVDILLSKPANFSLLVRFNDYITFCHRSFFEFFLAEQLYDKPNLRSQAEFIDLIEIYPETAIFYYQKLWLFLKKDDLPAYLIKISSYADLKQITKVNFSSFDQNDRNIISKLRNVTELVYERQEDKEVDQDELFCLRDMIKIDFKDLPLNDRHLKLIVANNPYLQTLNLRLTQLSDLSSIDQLCSMEKLSYLDISETPLLSMIFEQKSSRTIATLSDLFSKGVSINTKNDYNSTLLSISARLSKSDVIDFLIKNGADINSQNNEGSTALMIATRYNKLEVIKLLVENGADVNAKQTTGDTALMVAANHNTLEVVKYLVENGADVNAKKNDGSTALTIATHHNTLEVIKYLVENGADVNAKQTTGDTALMVAANHNTLEVVKYLVENGADFESRKEDGWNAVMLATQHNSREVIEYLLKKKGDINDRPANSTTALIIAAQHRDLDIIKLLIENGADINAKQPNSWNALMTAANHNTLDVVKYLVEHGADINHRNKWGYDALMIAESHSQSEIVKYLISVGAAPNRINFDAQTIYSSSNIPVVFNID